MTITVRCIACGELIRLRPQAVAMDGLFYRFTCLACGAHNRRVMKKVVRKMFIDLPVSMTSEIDAEVARFSQQLVDGFALERWLTP